jgi:hypothetical protein
MHMITILGKAKPDRKHKRLNLEGNRYDPSSEQTVIAA